MIPISDILIRSISGYVFMVPVFVLYFLWLKKLGRTQSFLHTAAVFVFGYYLFGLLTVTGIGLFAALILVQLVATGAAAFRFYYKQRKGLTEKRLNRK